MFRTQFDVVLQAYSSAYYDGKDEGRMSYILYGIVDFDDRSKDLRLMAGYKEITDPALTNDFSKQQLPGLKAVMAEIKDAHGEVVSIQKEVEVTRDPTQRWSDIYINRKETII